MEAKDKEDVFLISRISRGEQGALSELYDRYARLVYSLAFNALGDVSLSEEVTQEVFLRIWQKATLYQAEQAKVYTWIVSITRNLTIDVLRKIHRQPQLAPLPWAEEDSALNHESSDVEQAAEQSIRYRQIRRAMEELPPEQKQALAYAFFGGYSHQEIADLLDQPLGTVKTRIRLGMQKLRQALEEEAFRSR